MWAAHDDWRERHFLSACVEALERDPGAVLCSGVSVAVSEATGSLTLIPKVELKDPVAFQRVRRLLCHSREHVNYSSLIYGVLRTSWLRQAMPLGPDWGGDVLMLWRLACLGTFLHSRDALSYFQNRAVAPEEYNAYCKTSIADPTAERPARFPRFAFSNRFLVGSRGLWRLPLGLRERTLLIAALAGSVLSDRETYIEVLHYLARASGLRKRAPPRP
jgi:hypothetical protein